MKRRLASKHRNIVFIFLFALLLVYQDEFIIRSNRILNNIHGVFQTPTVGNKAYAQSFGFFTDINDATWKEFKRRYREQHRHKNNDVRNKRNHIEKDTNKNSSSGSSHLFYRDNYDAEFTCLNEMQLGVAHENRPHPSLQTPKWLCDPKRIVAASNQRKRKGDNGCLIYFFDSGHKIPLRILQDFREEVGNECEIHLFSPKLNERGTKRLFDSGTNIILHSWGLEGHADAHQGRRNYLTFHETLSQLNHQGHIIDAVSIDCEDGCEWSTYKDILESNAHITQILIELHGTPYQVNDFFLEMRKLGYVIFHKESNTVENGANTAYSFIRLAPSFFQDD